MIDLQKLKQFPLAYRAFETWTEKKYETRLALFLDKVKNEDVLLFLDIDDIYISVNIEFIGSDEWEFSYEITHLPIQHCLQKRRVGYFETIRSYKEYGGSYTGAWRNRTEATEAAITKAFELLEKKLNTN